MFLKNLFKIKNLLVLFGFALVFIYIFCFLVCVDKGNAWNWYNIYELFNSDSLYFSSLYRDLFIENNSIMGVNLTTTPNVFPSMFLYLIVRLFVHNFIWGQLINGFILILCLIFLFYQIIKRIVDKNAEYLFILSCSAFVLFFIHSVNYNDLIFSSSWLILPYHIGAFLVALCSISLTINYIKNSKKSNLLIVFVLNIITVFSNKIYLVYFIIPVIITLLLFTFYKERKYFILIIVNILSSAIGIVLYEVIKKMEWFTVSAPPLFSFDNTKNSFAFFYIHFSGFFLEGSVRSLILILCTITLILILLFLIINFKKVLIKRNPNNLIYFYFVFIFIFSIITILAPVINGLYIDSSNIRYNIFVLHLLSLNFPVVVFQFIHNQKVLKVSSILLLLLLFGYSFNILSKKNIKEEINKISNFKPEVAKKLDKVYLSNGLTNGVANYWDARNSYMFNSYSARVLAVDEGYNPTLLAANKNLYYSPSKKMTFNFVILNVFRKDDLLLKKFGNNVQKLLDEDGIAIYKVPEFSFNEKLEFYFIVE
jgi:hypothetical protein